MSALELNELLLRLHNLITRMESGDDNDPGDTVIELAKLLGEAIAMLGSERQ